MISRRVPWSMLVGPWLDRTRFVPPLILDSGSHLSATCARRLPVRGPYEPVGCAAQQLEQLGQGLRHSSFEVLLLPPDPPASLGNIWHAAEGVGEEAERHLSVRRHPAQREDEVGGLHILREE